MDKALRILGLITEKNDPSSRARILQYVPALIRENITTTAKSYYPTNNTDPARWMNRTGKITGINPWRFLWLFKNISRFPLLAQQHFYDLIWQNRMIITHHSWFEQKLKKPRVFDFDDAIWLRDGEKQVQNAIKTADEVFAGNDYLAEYAVRYNSNVQIIPSVIDTSRLFPLHSKDKPFTIGWIGSASNIHFLAPVKPAIIEFLRRYPGSRFILVSSSPGDLFQFDDQRILFRQWSAQKENELINSFSVGLMPLTDDAFTRGKCSYKMLQYMACGVPVLVSPVGTNEPILQKSESGLAAEYEDSWLNGLCRMKEETDMYEQFCQHGPAFIEQHYSVNTYAPIIANRFRKLTGK